MKKVNIITLSIVSSLALNAVEVPNISDAIKQVTPPTIERDKPQIPKIELQEKDTLKEFKDGRKAKIEKIIISGAEHIDIARLNKLVASYEHKVLSFKDILEVTTLITKEYRNQGYFVARAYLPAQDMVEQKNNLKINIIEGNYGEFILENNSLVKDSILQGNLDSIKEANIISTNTLERAMLIINDTPGVKVTKAEVKPGKDVGTSDFVIGTEPTKRYNGFIIGDNYGSQYTGKHRIMAGADINSPFNIGDKLSFFGLLLEEEGLLSGRAAYNFPMYQNGLRGELSYSKTSYELGSIYNELDATGTSDSVAFRTTYPIIKSSLENLDIYLDTSYNYIKDEIVSQETKKDSLVARLGTEYQKDYVLFDKNAQSKVDFSLSVGDLSFKDSQDKIDDKNSANTQGTYSKVNLDLSQNFALTEKLRWENTLKLQYALGNKNLDGTEDLSLGGMGGVRFYPIGEESAENGYIYNTELLYRLPNLQNLNTTISVFYDVGKVHMSRNISTENNRVLQDIGIGLYASYNDFFVNAHLAKNIAHEVESEKDYENKFLVQLGWVF